ncbi:MAG: permease [Chloroflexi bacterium]|nr:permease [Chloroflexota bacterium]
MTTGILKPSAHRGDTRAFSLVAIAAILWLIAYSQLENFAQWLTYALLRLEPETHLADSVEFFLADVPKILLLLSGTIFGVTILRTFFSAERARQLLGGKRQGIGNLLAAMLGIITPFCSCSAVPLFIGFVESGIPLGVTFSFLMASPMVNEVALVMLFGLFGWQVAVMYAGAGVAIAITAGWVIGALGLEKYVEDFVWKLGVGAGVDESRNLTWTDRIERGGSAVKEIVAWVWLYVVIGIAFGAGIHGYVPENFLAEILGPRNPLAVIAAVLVGIPLYSNAAGVMPVVSALMEKGAGLGTVLAFMMAVVGLSLPEMIILRRVLKWELIAIFIGVMAVGIIAIGILFNLVS